ncbi:PRD domain protein [Oceanobacillus oncorhynchi]|uniref:PRD domain protein n=1 Tax=Oceanobacillus oncorhynchi TaxID=545501 RepID=A0A0A1MM62_9BACI|nr:PRD domain-containing protein [Oceanobacillus oncorhynchi]CEI80899.1 PRD domain protein [Oceanobacillus oncorhynchi]
MEKQEMKIKLNILLETETITNIAYDVSNKTFDYLSGKYKKQSLDGSDMFWTHLCMALTRIERGETLEGPSENIMKEINQTPYKDDIEEIISFVNAQLNQKLPKEERDFFYLHLHGVIENNK